MWHVSKLNPELTKKKKQKMYDVITGVDPIIRVKQGYLEITKTEKEMVEGGQKLDKRLKNLEISPTPIFFGGSKDGSISGSFVLYQEQVQKCP